MTTEVRTSGLWEDQSKRDAVIEAARVVLGSGIGIIDRAALESIRNARYPESPAEILGSDHVYLVWVEFTH